MAPHETADDDYRQQNAITGSIRLAHDVNKTSPVDTGEPGYADLEDIEVEVSPHQAHFQKLFETRGKPPQVATTSSRLQLPVAQYNILDTEAFSFAPAHLPCTSAQSQPRRSVSPAVPIGQESNQQDGSKLSPHTLSRKSESPLDAESNLTAERVDGKPSRDDHHEQFIDDDTSALRQKSSITELENMETQHTPPLSDDMAESHDDYIRENNSVQGNDPFEHTVPFDARVVSTSESDGSHLAAPLLTIIDSRIQRSPHTSTDNQDIVDLTESPSMFGHVRPDRLDQHPKVAAPVHGDRVSKPSRRRRPRPGPILHPQRQGNAKQPSEEDLLFLLMSRARQNNDTRKRLEYLEHENENLRQEKVQLDSELQQALHSRDESIHDYDLLGQNLETFKDKYHKLKKWALETNKDCEELQERASSFQRALSDLTKDKDQLLTQLHNVQSSSESASRQTESVWKSVHEVKVMADERLACINQLTTVIMAEDEKLTKETQQCRKLESHINHLVKERDMRNVRMHNEQQELNQSLQVIAGKLDALQDARLEDSSEKGHILECLDQIQSAINNDLSKQSDISSLKDDIGSATVSLDKVENSVSGTLQRAIATLKEDLQKDVSVEARKLLSVVANEHSKLAGARETLARLEQKVKQTQEMVKLLQDAKATTENNRPQLKTMADDLAKAVGPEREAARKRISDLGTDVSELRIKWQAACSQLEKCNQKREEQRTEHHAQLEKCNQDRKDEQEKREAEYEAEVVDLIGLLCEAMQEENCLRSELSKAEDFLDEAQRQNAQQQIEMVDRDHRTNCRFSHLQNQIEHQNQQRKANLAEIERLTFLQLHLQKNLEERRGETIVAIREQHALHDEIADLERHLECAGHASRQLSEVVRQLSDVRDELEVLKRKQPSLEQLEQDALIHQQEIEAKVQEIQTLGKEAEKQQAKFIRLEEQTRERDRLAKENAALSKQHQIEVSVRADLETKLKQENFKVAGLESALATAQRQAQERDRLAEEKATVDKQLKEVEAKVSVIPALQKTLQQRHDRIGELESALADSQGQAQEKEKFAAENSAVKKQVAQLQKENLVSADVQTELQQKNLKVAELEIALAAAQDRAALVDEMEEKTSSLKEHLISLNSDLEQMTEQCAQIGPLKDTIKAKEVQLAESQHLVGCINGQIEDLEEDHATMQQQILNLEGALSNAKLDKEANQPQQPRKIADRTQRTNLLLQGQLRRSQSHLSGNGPLPGNGDTFVSSAGTAIVPETQPEVPESLQDKLILHPYADEDESESKLSPLPSEDEDDALEEETQRNFAKTTRFTRGQGYISPTKDLGGVRRSQQLPERPPSSSYGSQSDQMLLDQVSQGDPLGADDTASGSTGANPVLPWHHLASTQGLSPRRLRSGSQGPSRVHSGLLGSDNQHERKRASTPSVRREQYQPNSAAKRRMEPENEEYASQENPKRLKRRPANLEVRPPQPRTPKQAEQTPSRGPGSWRKSSTVVGTNAPAPGESQRSAKPARKGSRRDKFAARFASDT